MKMKSATREITITALFIALVAVLVLTNIGLIPLVVVSLNLTLVILLVCGQTTSLRTSVIVTTAFGIFSLINAYLRPTTLLAFATQNPLVSVLPRVFIGLTTYLSYHAFVKIFSKSESKFVSSVLPSAISAGIGTLTNTFLFLGMLLLVYNGAGLSNGGVVGLPLIFGIVVSNTIAEFAISVVIVPILTLGVKRAIGKKTDDAEEIKKEDEEIK